MGERIGEARIGVEANEALKPKENPYTEKFDVSEEPVVEVVDKGEKFAGDLKGTLHKIYLDLLMSDPGRGKLIHTIESAIGEFKKAQSLSGAESELSTLREYVENIGKKLESDVAALKRDNVRTMNVEENKRSANEIVALEAKLELVQKSLESDSSEQEVAAA